jgi:hypothetical protein
MTNLLYERKINLYGYDEKDSILTINFKNGISKSYYGVPKPLYENLMNAYDKNGFYRMEIEGLFCVK